MKALEFITRHSSGCRELDKALLDFIEAFDDSFLEELLEEEKRNFDRAYCALLLSFLLRDEPDDEDYVEENEHNLHYN